MDPYSPSQVVQYKDEEHLRLLSVFHYVVGVIGGLIACLPLIHVTIGILMVTSPKFLSSGGQAAPPAGIGYFFIIFGGVFVLIGWTMAICTIISGRFLAKRRRRTFTFVVAAILCTFFPFGTILGIFTIIVLSRSSVQLLYADAERRRDQQLPN